MVMNTEDDINVNGLNVIKKWEGLYLTAYLCPAGVWTIGWGHTDGVHPGMSITEAQAEAFLIADVQWAESVIERLVTVDLNNNQFSALVSLVFNIGEGNFRGSTALRRINAGDFTGAAEAILWWNKARVNGTLTVLQGLVDRRRDEAALFLDENISLTRQDIAENREMPQAVSARGNEVTPFSRTREVATTIGASGGAATVVGGFFNSLHPAAQVALVIGGLVVVGAVFYFVLLPKLKARARGES